MHTPTTEAHPETPCARGRSLQAAFRSSSFVFASDDRGPVLLVPRLVQPPALLLVGRPFPGSSGDSLGQVRGWLSLAPGTPVALAAGCRVPGALRARGDRVDAEGSARGRPECAQSGVAARSSAGGGGRGPGRPPRACSCPVPATVPVAEAGSRPFYSCKLTVVVRQPKVTGLCFGIFFLVFRFFLNKVFF